MDSVAKMGADERAVLMRLASDKRKSLPPEVIEKDFWVCWVLGRLFGSPQMARKILFKGGTSLSKVFGLIERFSEDIDLILDWKEVTREDPRADRSVSRQDVFNKELLRRAHVYLRETFLPEVRLLVEGVCEAAIEENPEVVKIKYPTAFPSDYLRAEIQLEVGPLAAWVPNAEYEIRSYAAEALPSAFRQPTCRVRAIKAERTFWEKITILHHEAHRPVDSPQPAGYSRHYYDVCRMAPTRVKTDALADLDLLRAVVAFKDKFYHRGWARYDLAKPGTIKLVPPEHVMKAVATDYEGMRLMIFGERLDFRDIVEQLRALESEINAL
jgi:hypothetical protein